MQILEVNALFDRVEVGVQRVTHHRWLLVDFFLHVVVIVALADQGARELTFDNRAINLLVRSVVDRRAIAGQNAPIAVFDVAQRVGERCQRNRVRAQIHFTIAITNGQRRAFACADHQVVVA